MLHRRAGLSATIGVQNMRNHRHLQNWRRAATTNAKRNRKLLFLLRKHWAVRVRKTGGNERAMFNDASDFLRFERRWRPIGRCVN